MKAVEVAPRFAGIGSNGGSHWGSIRMLRYHLAVILTIFRGVPKTRGPAAALCRQSLILLLELTP